MGVPIFTNWLLSRYPGAIELCLSWRERKGSHISTYLVKKDDLKETSHLDCPVETRIIDTEDGEYKVVINQSRLEFDNLYVDMYVKRLSFFSLFKHLD